MDKTEQVYDVIVVGAGIVGLSCACALARNNLKVVVIDKKSPDLQSQKYDARVCSLNQSSQNLLDYCGAMQHCQENLSDINHMKVWDDHGGGCIDFHAYEIGIDHLAKVVVNRDLQRSLWQVAQYSPFIDIKVDCCIEEIEKNSDYISIFLKNKQSIKAKLLVAADGGNSWVRSHLEFSVTHKPYNHSAVVGIIEIEKNHQATAVQSFLSLGPIGVLPSYNNNECSFVWSTSPEYATSLMDMDKDCFNDTLAEAIQWYYGDVKLLSSLYSIPLSMRHAKRYIDQRVVLLGDAAHTIHPLAGQGLNLGLFDVAYLIQSINDGLNRNYDIGSERVLRQYERSSRSNNEVMISGMKLFKELFTKESSMVVSGRSGALNFVNRYSFIKKFFIRYAIGERADLPESCYAKSS